MFRLILTSPNRGRNTAHPYLFSMGPRPTLVQRGGGGGRRVLHVHIYFPIGPCQSLVQKGGGGGNVPEMPPRSTYEGCDHF